MSDTILNEDLLDEGLQAVMGPDRCQPNWRLEPKKSTGKDKPINTQWEPIKPDPNWLGRLRACVREVVPCSSICLLIFYWQQTGLMDSTAAVPSMLACMLLAGVGIGKNILK